MAYQEKQLQEISRQFQIYGEILHAETLKIGHINETYTTSYDQGSTRVHDIHHTRKRFETLKLAIQNDHYNRAKDAGPEIAFALEHEGVVDVILDAMKRKKIPERITHNDTKFNNVMLDLVSGEAMCIVDLD